MIQAIMVLNQSNNGATHNPYIL